MWNAGRSRAAAALLCVLAPGALEAQSGKSDEAAFLRAVGEHFATPPGEVMVLSRWDLSTAEIPVVLRLATRAGVPPDVVVAQRRRGASWLEIARTYSVHAGDFHVPINGSAGFLAAVYARFEARVASEWRDVSLSDEELVGLVNVRFLSRSLGVPASSVLSELGGGDVVAAYIRLSGRY
ncbi:MAG: hypothetical protein F4Z31_21885 [Gemmatimonadetes bacterium]|nr:hypothetical protein [Gemmatimonadota bacterium]MYA44388.1 hypothetical protein [Gemmatimonadota bacterium]MYE93690.1 hypothetical protein [Gemmatimonadota bacterium]MYJ10553.1 hypothetical protein [Gemmatimonadota bacterium]